MKEYEVRHRYSTGRWAKFDAGNPSLAAQFLAEDRDYGDGDEIEVKGEGFFIVRRIIQIEKI